MAHGTKEPPAPRGEDRGHQATRSSEGNDSAAARRRSGAGKRTEQFVTVPVALVHDDRLGKVKGWAVAAYAELMAHRNEGTRRCFPSRKTLAEKLGCSEGTVKRALGTLARAGWITRETRQGHANGYVLHERSQEGVGSRVARVTGGPTPGSRVTHELDEGYLDDTSGGGPEAAAAASLSAQPDPPGTLRVQPAPVSTKGLVAYFVSESRKRGVTPPADVNAWVGCEVRKLAAEDGCGEDLLRAALDLLVSKGLSPGTLPNLVYEVQQTGGLELQDLDRREAA